MFILYIFVLFVCCIFIWFCLADLVSGCKIYIQAGTALTRCCQPMSASFHPFRFYILGQNMCRIHPDKDFINSLAIILVVFLCSIRDFPIWVFVLHTAVKSFPLHSAQIWFSSNLFFLHDIFYRTQAELKFVATVTSQEFFPCGVFFSKFNAKFCVLSE